MAKPRYAGIDADNLNSNAPKEGFIESFTESGVSMIKTSTVKTAEPFLSLFPINEDVLQSVIASMREKGFDPSQPLIIWREKKILLDGHTRLKSALTVGIDKVPVIYLSFGSEEAALDYMYHLQFSRRNVTDSELVPLAIRAMEKYEKKYGEGSKAEFLVKRFPGLSLAKAKQLSVVLDKADESITDIINGTKTIYNVYAHINKTKKDKTTPRQKVSPNFLNKTESVSNDRNQDESSEQSPNELELNEGNIYHISPAGKNVVVSVAPRYHSQELLQSLYAAIKLHLKIN